MSAPRNPILAPVQARVFLRFIFCCPICCVGTAVLTDRRRGCVFVRVVVNTHKRRTHGRRPQDVPVLVPVTVDTYTYTRMILVTQVFVRSNDFDIIRVHTAVRAAVLTSSIFSGSTHQVNTYCCVHIRVPYPPTNWLQRHMGILGRKTGRRAFRLFLHTAGCPIFYIFM